MAKLGLFWYSKIGIFVPTIRKGQPYYFAWYLEVSKKGSYRVISSQETNKKLLETISELKKAASTYSARSQV